MKNLMIAFAILFMFSAGCQWLPIPAADSDNDTTEENTVEFRLACETCDEESCSVVEFAACSILKGNEIAKIAEYTLRRKPGKPATCFEEAYNCITKEEFLSSTLKVFTIYPDLVKVTVSLGGYIDDNLYAVGEVQEYNNDTHIADVKLTVVNNQFANEYHTLRIESTIRVEDEKPTIFIGELGQ